jgi:hypothetical protein
MSSIALSGNASGAGVFTVAAPNSASSYTATLPQQTGTLVAGTSTANAVIPAGTTAIAPVLFTSGTNLTSATAGAMEYDGKVIYATPQGTQRGVVPGSQFFRLNADLAGANATGAQSILGVGVTLSASTVYAFQLYFVLTKSAGATSRTVSLGFGGTATLNNFAYNAVVNSVNSAYPTGALTSTPSTLDYNSASAIVIVAASTSTATQAMCNLQGTVSINAGGTFIPQYTLSAAPGGAYSTVAGSYMLIYPISASGANTSVGTWA